MTHKENCNTIVLQGDDFMAMDATLQIRIDSAVKEQVEALYRSLGTSFAEAVRMFAQQSLQEGGMPFRPSLRAWDDMSETEISEKLSRSSEDIAAGRISAQCDMDAKVKELLQSRAARIKDNLHINIRARYYVKADVYYAAVSE